MIDDWRLLKGQENYLYGVQLIYHAYIPANPHNDHDHCEFCMEKFGNSPKCLHVGYSTIDNEIWICEQCYYDFKKQFEWKI